MRATCGEVCRGEVIIGAGASQPLYVGNTPPLATWPKTYALVLAELLDRLIECGFRRILIVNGIA
jgi:hypothetical protein